MCLSGVSVFWPQQTEDILIYISFTYVHRHTLSCSTKPPALPSLQNLHTCLLFHTRVGNELLAFCLFTCTAVTYCVFKTGDRNKSIHFLLLSPLRGHRQEQILSLKWADFCFEQIFTLTQSIWITSPCIWCLSRVSSVLSGAKKKQNN